MRFPSSYLLIIQQIHSPARFELMTQRFVVNAQTHCTTLFGKNAGKDYKFHLILCLIFRKYVTIAVGGIPCDLHFLHCPNLKMCRRRSQFAWYFKFKNREGCSKYGPGGCIKQTQKNESVVIYLVIMMHDSSHKSITLYLIKYLFVLISF